MQVASALKQQQQNMVIELSNGPAGRWAGGRKKFNPKDPFCHRKTVLHDIKCLMHQMSFSSKTKEAVRHTAAAGASGNWQQGL